MGEIVIPAKFNAHKIYKKMMFLNPYRDVGGGVSDPDSFNLLWQTTTVNESIEIGLGIGKYDFDYTIDWGDGTVEAYSTSDNISHIYEVAGFYETKITGSFSYPYMVGTPLANRDKLMEITQWGNVAFRSFRSSFERCENLQYTATDTPSFSSNSMAISSAFKDCLGLTSIANLSQWEWSKVAIAPFLFNNCRNLVIDSSMSNIDVSGINRFYRMFNLVKSADISLANWDVTAALGGQYTGFYELFHTSDAGLSTPNYDATLISWAQQSVKNGVYAGFGQSQYTLGGAAETARNTLINTYGWIIEDGGGI